MTDIIETEKQSENHNTKHQTQKLKRVLVGKIVSNKCMKTLAVLVERKVKHRLYKKVVTKSRKFQVHYEEGSFNLGDMVEIVETRPISKTKSWKLNRLLKAAVV